jgi:putative endonuclease
MNDNLQEMIQKKRTLAVHYRQGMDGEEAAAIYLYSQGYEIRGRNYRFRKAEIDILAFKEGVLVVVEVKTRTKGFYEPLSHTVSRLKIQRLVRAANHYVREKGLEVEVRFDVIQVFGQCGNYELRHLENAFYFF